ncbi:ImmA/IrrE family metallo-endopeptidase [Roseibium aggregatum]|uniref:helix-turn-helix domain-containing protein n=1 Tax=Roseibium aggregatum TaxID=187304 RepID=UPI001E4FD4F9|nr:XRE family transcriptional regulator [Roseibium aggregatum]UES55811.1 ImmA/IrrE family metallo-endopeptidase [Roseibium aggregatum]
MQNVQAVVDSKVFNPDMLKLARDARELTQAELARQSGITQAFISKLEHGLNTQPGDEAMERIAVTLRFPVAFFYQREKAVGFPHFHFRKRSRLGAKPLARIGAVINIRRQHIAKLLRSYEFEAAKPIPQIDLDETGLTPEKVAERLRAYWMVPRGPIKSVVELIEDAGGIVVLARFGTNLMDGLSFRTEGMPPLFFMNKDVPGDRFRFSLAHELGHMVMHSIPDDDAKMEDEAHRFAAAFLMPSAEIKPYLAGAKLSNMGRVKAYWKVSIKSLIKRTHDLKLITPSQYKYMNIQYNKVFREGEPVAIDMEQPTRLRQIIDFHKNELGYSTEDLAQLLAFRPQDVERVYCETNSGLRLVVSN